MAFNLPKLSAPLVKPAGKRKSGSAKKADKPVADRAFVADEFIESCNPYNEDDEVSEAEMLINAWRKSPERTVIALSRSGLDPAEIAKKFGCSDDSEEFKSVYASAKELCKRDACEPILSQLPDTFPVPVMDDDGNEYEVDCADKLKKAIQRALLTQKPNPEIVFSVARNTPFGIRAESGEFQRYTLKSLLGLTLEQVAIHQSRIYTEYATTFKSRRTGQIQIDRPLPPGLANAAAKLEPNDDTDDTGATPEVAEVSAD